MFGEFLKFFNEQIEYQEKSSVYESFLECMEGQQFGGGVFMSFKKNDIMKWTKIIEEAFPDFAGQFKLFGYDWLGRCFGIDVQKGKQEKILMFEIGTKDVLGIPGNLWNFLNKEIPLHSDACLAMSFYEQWLKEGGLPVTYGRCIGYKIPLFLGGADTIDNLEDSDMEVYWYILSKIEGSK